MKTDQQSAGEPYSRHPGIAVSRDRCKGGCQQSNGYDLGKLTPIHLPFLCIDRYCMCSCTRCSITRNEAQGFCILRLFLSDQRNVGVNSRNSSEEIWEKQFIEPMTEVLFSVGFGIEGG